MVFEAGGLAAFGSGSRCRGGELQGLKHGIFPTGNAGAEAPAFGRARGKMAKYYANRAIGVPGG
jgi:hypothetical protein